MGKPRRVSLYKQLGGEHALATLADDFYSRMVSDDLLAPWFARADHDRLRLHLRAYLAVALGGPEGYSGRSMRRAHSGLRITGGAFDTVLLRLSDALEAASFEPPLMADIVSVVSTLRPVVVEVPG